LIEDTIEILPKTKKVVWQLMTTADVEIVKGGAILKQNGQKLKLDNLSRPDLPLEIIPLDPPPHKLDRKIEKLKRIELIIPAKVCSEGETKIKIQLSG